MVCVMLADGFEEIEALTVVDVLRRADVDVRTVSVSNEETVKGAHGILVSVDQGLSSCVAEQTEMIVLPGGMPGTTNLFECGALQNFLVQCRDRAVTIAAICAAPMILGEWGFLDGKKATCYPGFESHLKGAIHSAERVVHDGIFITSKGPGTAMEFALYLAGLLKGEGVSAQLASGMIFHAN